MAVPLKKFGIFLLLVAVFISKSTSYVLGELSYDDSGYIEYFRGNLPIILTAPHGGSLEPSEIPDRSCFGCTYTKDASTEIVAKMLAEALYNKTGCHSHLVVNTLHRIKLDANREIGDAACGDPIAESAWYGFQSLIESAKISFNSTTPGFLVDVHGQSHLIPRIEIGYLLTANDLAKTDLNLDDEVDTTSVRSVSTRIPPLSSLIRGPYAFGTLLENAGFPTIPSEQQPSVGLLEGFYSGGYVTNRHGSRFGGNIDAFQMEMGYALRNEEDQRNSFAPAFADIVVDFLNRWYSIDEATLRSFCEEEDTSSDDDNDDDDNEGKNNAGAIVAAILIPIFLIGICLIVLVVVVVVVTIVLLKKRAGNEVELQKV